MPPLELAFCACVLCLRFVVAFFSDFVNSPPNQITQFADFQYALCDGTKSDEVRSLLIRIRIRGINDNRDNAVHGCLYCRLFNTH